jgi:hypothetical protein
MNKRTRILSGVCALMIGLSLALPMRAAADDKDHDRGHQHQTWRSDHDRDHQHQAWRWQRDENYYRAYPYTPPPAYYSYWQQQQYLPENGEGMINPRNPNLYWACDSEGHHCHWAPRPRYRAPRYY